MTSGEGYGADEVELFELLRPELPAVNDLAARVGARVEQRSLSAEQPLAGSLDDAPAPRGIVLRMADRIGLRRTAASIVGPVLLPMGLARPSAISGAVLKGAVPKGVLSTLAMPIALLVAIGLTMGFSLRKSKDLQGEADGTDAAAQAIARWWKDHFVHVAVFLALLFAVSAWSYDTARALLFLMGLVAFALCAEVLSRARKATRRAMGTMAISLAGNIYCATIVMTWGADFAGIFTGKEMNAEEQLVNYMLDGTLSLACYGAALLAAVQGNSRFRGFWQLMIKGTDKDLGRLAGIGLMLLGIPAYAMALMYYVGTLEGSLGERLWGSRDHLAWFAFCLHGLVVIWRAPLIREETDGG